METGFAFRDKLNARPTLVSIWNQASENCCGSHFSLLPAFPAIRVSQNIFNAVLDRGPNINPVDVSLLNVSFCTIIKVSHEIGE
jgi:hypothetical protein